MSEELRREVDRGLHELQHQIIEDFLGDKKLAVALYPECYRAVVPMDAR